LNKIIKKINWTFFFSLEVSLNELTNNQSETKAKINSQIKLCSQKSLETILRSNALNGPLLLLSVNIDRSKA